MNGDHAPNQQEEGSSEPIDNWVIVRKFDNLISLDQTRVYLEQLGYDVQVKDDHTLQADPVIAVAIGGAGLMVRKGDAEAVGLLMEERFGTPDLENVRRLNAKVKKNVFKWVAGFALGLLLAGMIFDPKFFAPEHLISNLIIAGVGAAVLLLVYFFYIRSPYLDDDDIDEDDAELVPEDEEEPDWVKDIDWDDDPEEGEADADAGSSWGGGYSSDDSDGGD